MVRGIYTVANDKMANQLIALLNSFQQNWSNHYPIIVIPYDDNCLKIQEIIKEYSSFMPVEFLNDQEVLTACDKYFTILWDTCDQIKTAWKTKNKSFPFRLGMCRRFIGFLFGEFDQFLYVDADVYINRNLEDLFEFFNQYDAIAHDYQFTDPTHVFNMKSSKISQLVKGDLKDKIQCGGFLMAKKNLFSKEQWRETQKTIYLDQDVLHPWGPDQTLYNYLLHRYNVNFVNLIRYWPEEKRTRDAQTFSKFEFKNGQLYDQGRLITYFHHIGVPADEINLVCAGKKPKYEFRYQDVFLYFRYLKEQEKCPRPEIFGK